MIYVDPRDVIVEVSYQRAMDQRRVNRIADGFDFALFGVPLVSRRNGKVYCVDGQHRLAAAIKKGINKVPVQIVEDLSVRDEAYVWGAVNNYRKLHSSLEAFKGALVSGSDVHVQIDEIVTGLGLRMNRNSAEDAIGAAGMLLQVERRGGVPLVRDTLTLIKNVWYGYPMAWDKRFISGVAVFLHTYERIIDWDDLVTALRKGVVDNGTPHQILNKSDEHSSGLVGTAARTVACAYVLKSIYNKHGKHKYGSLKRRDKALGDYRGFVPA
jgi:hypothetical protein